MCLVEKINLLWWLRPLNSLRLSGTAKEHRIPRSEVTYMYLIHTYFSLYTLPLAQQKQNCQTAPSPWDPWYQWQQFQHQLYWHNVDAHLSQTLSVKCQPDGLSSPVKTQYLKVTLRYTKSSIINCVLSSYHIFSSIRSQNHSSPYVKNKNLKHKK